MCHEAVLSFGSELTSEDVAGKRVLEVGSYNINGSLRSHIQMRGCREYIGVDIQAGPGVDQVCSVKNLVKRFGEASFDVVISTEMLEHVKDWRTAVSNIKQVCKPDGLILMTTRSTGFKRHEYPGDFWRFDVPDMALIFMDCEIRVLAPDPQAPGVFMLARKKPDCKEVDLSTIQAQNIRTSISIVSCVSNQDVYKHNFLDREFPPETQLIPVYDANSAAQGLNHGISQAVHDVVVCCHQDTYLPADWALALNRQITEIGNLDYGVLGTFGIDLNGKYAGNIKQPNGNPKMGKLPCRAQSLDEHCLVIRQLSGLRFDEDLGGWHMYGADICIQAMERGMKNYVIDAYLEHMSNGKVDESFHCMANRFCAKWQKIGCSRSEVKTTCGSFVLRD